MMSRTVTPLTGFSGFLPSPLCQAIATVLPPERNLNSD